MDKIDASDLLSQLKAMASMAQADFKTTGPEAAGKTDFSALLKGAIDHVNDIQNNAGQLETSFDQGDPNVSLVQVMVALQKADVSFQAMTEVRNKLVTAYQDVMNLPM